MSSDDFQKWLEKKEEEGNTTRSNIALLSKPKKQTSQDSKCSLASTTSKGSSSVKDYQVQKLTRTTSASSSLSLNNNKRQQRQGQRQKSQPETVPTKSPSVERKSRTRSQVLDYIESVENEAAVEEALNDNDDENSELFILDNS